MFTHSKDKTSKLTVTVGPTGGNFGEVKIIPRMANSQVFLYILFVFNIALNHHFSNR